MKKNNWLIFIFIIFSGLWMMSCSACIPDTSKDKELNEISDSLLNEIDSLVNSLPD